MNVHERSEPPGSVVLAAGGGRTRSRARRFDWSAADRVEAVRVVGLGVGCFVAGQVGTKLASVSVVSAIWPAAGVALAGLLLLGLRAWPAVFVGGFLEVVSHGVAVPVALGVAAGQTLTPAAAIWLLRRTRFDPRLERLSDVVGLVLIGGFASNVISATIGTGLLRWSGVIPPGQWALGWFVWWVGDVIGVLTIAPLLLLLLPAKARSASLPPAERYGEVALLLIGTAAASSVLLRGSLPLVFLIFPFALWAALRLGAAAAAAANVVIATVAVWITATNHGPFAGLPSTVRLASLQSFNASVVIMSLLLATVMNERRRALLDVSESRTRIVEAADAERRRIERDLHDGAQQQLMSVTVSLARVLNRLPDDTSPEVREALANATQQLQSAHTELRALARGIHPAVLTQRGLTAALHSLAETAAIPVEVHGAVPRCSPLVEATAYFVASEALANVTKHARATSVRVTCRAADAGLVLEVTDNGVGGADRAAGGGLTGLVDRVTAVGGTLTIESPAGRGTVLRMELPCEWS
ncbi:MAG: MASE1 domain-containing protein [Actinomycetota bacterium]